MLEGLTGEQTINVYPLDQRVLYAEEVGLVGAVAKGGTLRFTTKQCAVDEGKGPRINQLRICCEEGGGKRKGGTCAVG